MLEVEVMVKNLFRLDQETKVRNIDQFNSIVNEAQETKKRGNTQLVAALTPFQRITGFKQSLVKGGFHIEQEWGNLLLVSKGNEVPFYAFLDKNSFVLFVTLARKTEDISATVLNYINSTGDVALVRIGKRRMRQLRDQLATNYPDITLSYFTAHRDAFTSIPGAYREDVQRTIIYSGNDGFDTLEEMQYHYGIIPRIMELHLSEHDRFRIDAKGIFTIMEGTADGVFEIIKDVTKDVLRVTLPLPRGKKWHTRDAVVSVSMEEKWGGKQISRMEEALIAEWGITPIAPVLDLKRGYYGTHLVDVEDSANWELLITGNELYLLPGIGTGLRSLLKVMGVMEEHLSLTLPLEPEVMQ